MNTQNTELIEFTTAPVVGFLPATDLSPRRDYNNKIWFKVWLSPTDETSYNEAILFLFDKLGISRPNQSQKRNMRVLLANLAYFHVNKPQGVIAYFRGRGRWPTLSDWRNPYKVGFGTIDLIDRMSDAGYLHGPKGYRNATKSYASRMWPTSDFIAEVLEDFGLLDMPIQQHERFRYVQINIKDHKTETRSVPSPDAPRLIEMTEMLRRYNRQLSISSICIADQPEFRSKAVYRVFNSPDLNKGGRFYGGWWTNEKRDIRPLIKIDGQETVELDFKAMHIHLLYDLKADVSYVDVSQDGDPYNVTCSITGEAYPRQLIKDLFLIAINSKNENETWHALKDRYSDKESKYYKPEYIKKYVGKKESFKKVYKDLERKHIHISNNLSSNIGSELQYVDSQIAEIVLNEMTMLGITTLCIHDSFIVQKDKEGKLKEVMKEAYKQITGTTNEPIIE